MGEMKNAEAGGIEDVRVLFVEDDGAVAQMYRLKLELDGYQVEVAPDGEVALEMVRSSPPDLIFLDIRLPKLDGLDVLEALRADPATREARLSFHTLRRTWSNAVPSWAHSIT